jgi:hydroxymethylglutaryl-CoA lyase
MSFPRQVNIVEVAPRDGLQNERRLLSTATKIDFINQFSETGLTRIESGSFVSAKRVPQMADSGHVLRGIKRNPGTVYSALTPNMAGLETAIAAGADEVAAFAAASEAFSQKNINCTISESIQRFEPVLRVAQEHELPVRGYVSCVLGCPF